MSEVSRVVERRFIVMWRILKELRVFVLVEMGERRSFLVVLWVVACRKGEDF